MSDKYDNEYKSCREGMLKRLSEVRNISLEYRTDERRRLADELLEKIKNEKVGTEETDKKTEVK